MHLLVLLLLQLLRAARDFICFAYNHVASSLNAILESTAYPQKAFVAPTNLLQADRDAFAEHTDTRKNKRPQATTA